MSVLDIVSTFGNERTNQTETDFYSRKIEKLISDIAYLSIFSKLDMFAIYVEAQKGVDLSDCC